MKISTVYCTMTHILYHNYCKVALQPLRNCIAILQRLYCNLCAVVVQDTRRCGTTSQQLHYRIAAVMVLALTTFCLVISPASAQNTTIDPVVEKNEQKLIAELENVLKIRESNVKNLKKTISEQNLAKLQSKKQKLAERLQKAADIRMKKTHDILKNCSSVSPTFKADSARLAVLDDSLYFFNQYLIKKLIKDVDAKWLSKLFSQIDLVELQQECKRYKELVLANRTHETLQDAYYKIDMLLRAKLLYEAGKKAVESSYVAETVKYLTSLIKVLRDELTNADKKKEVTRIYSQLFKYQSSLGLFQDLINDLEKEKDFEGMKKVIEKQEEEDEIISSIEEIPWLKSQYDKFYQDLRSGMRPKDAGSAILKLKP